MIRLIAALVAALVVLGTSPGEAHRIGARNGPPPEGISITSLTHGQMAVIRNNLVRDPCAGRRPDRVRHDDLAAGRLPEPSVARLSLGSGPRQHRGRAEPIQRMRPRLPCCRAGAPPAIAQGAGQPNTKRSTRSSAGSRSRCWPTAHPSLCAATATSLSTPTMSFSRDGAKFQRTRRPRHPPRSSSSGSEARRGAHGLRRRHREDTTSEVGSRRTRRYPKEEPGGR